MAPSSACSSSSIISRPRRLRQSILHTLVDCAGGDRHHDAARVHLRLRADAQLHALEGVSGAIALTPILAPVAAGRDFVHPVVRHPGLAQVVGSAAPRSMVRSASSCQLDLCRVPARADDRSDGAAARRWPTVRSGGILGRPAVRRFFTITLPGAQIRPDQRRDGGLFVYGQRLRHTQGDRRQLQRAGARYFQAGHRAAEFQQGAVVSLILLLPVLVAFIVDWRCRAANRRNSPRRSVPYVPHRRAGSTR